MNKYTKIYLEKCLPWPFGGSLYDTTEWAAREWVDGYSDEYIEEAFFKAISSIRQDYEVK